MRQLSLTSHRRRHKAVFWAVRTFLLSTVILASDTVYAQKPTADQEERIKMPSTQTFDFMRYGNTPVNYNTGLATLNIPVYTYKDEDFLIPISLNYASEGYKPGRQSGYLGHNWSLAFGGVITREVRGVPDEQPYANSSSPVNGSFKRSSASNYVESSLLALTTGVNVDKGYTIAEGENNYELEPDIFRFNFMGYKGAFVVDGQKRVRVFDTQSAGEFMVDLTNIEHDRSLTNILSKISITTGDGYQYTFGGSNASTEYNVDVEATVDHSIGIPSDKGTISSWYLVEIKAPNGRVVAFEYEDNKGNTVDQWSNISNGYYAVTPVRFNGTKANLNKDYTDGMILWLIGNPPQTRFDITKLVYPKSINIDGVFTVSFGYSPKKKEYEYIDEDFINPMRGRLSSIECKNVNGIVVEKALMNYTERNIDFINSPGEDPVGNDITGGKKTFLDSVSLLTSGRYGFEYSTKEQSNLPCISVTNIDHWGYWNSKSDTTRGLIPSSSDSYREPSSYLFDVGLLTKVTYPTGGYSLFEYEQQHYYHVMGYSYGIGPFDKVMSNNPAGGARIKSIIDYDGIKSRKRQFDYQNSGILYDRPMYKTILEYQHKVSGLVNMVVLSSVGRTMYTMDPYIMYSTVREIFPDGSYDEYSYTDLGNSENHINRDDASGQVAILRPFIDTEEDGSGGVSNVVAARDELRIGNSRAFDRGQLMYKKSYLPNGTLLRSETTNYAHINSGDYVAAVPLYGNSGGLYINSYKIYTDIFLPASVTVTENMGGTNFTKTVSTGYNTYAQPTTIMTTDSRGIQQRTINSYVTTMTSPTDPALAAMKTKNIVRYPLETASQIGSDNKTIAATATTFVQAGGGVLPSQVKRLRLDTPQAGYTGYYGGAVQSNFDNVFSYDIYDSQGRIRQVTTKDGIKICYLWSYNNRYIVAKIEGATFNEVTAALNLTPDALAASSTSNLLTLNNMRNSLGAGALVTIYEHIPSVGVSSITEPSGRVLKYEYDSRNRLKFIKDENNKILEAYDIKLSTEP